MALKTTVPKVLKRQALQVGDNKKLGGSLLSVYAFSNTKPKK